MAYCKPILASLLGAALALTGPQTLAKSITLMQLGDTHGHMHSHPEIFPDERIDANSGGLAKLTTLINEVRADNPDNLLLGIGDTTHGSAEMLFSLGDLIMPWLNYIGIDVFTPGNWDFGWGPRVYRQRFTAANPPLAPNNRTTIAWMDPSVVGPNCNQETYFWNPLDPTGANPGTYPPYPSPFVPGNLCHVTKATFETVAMNLYNYNEVAGVMGGTVHNAYTIREVGGVKVGVLGLTSDVVPQQAQAFNTGFRFTMGYKEMPETIKLAKQDGAQIIVVLSELGFAKNIQMVKEFPEINVMFSGHTHERTPQEVVINHADGSFSLVTESGEDSFLGRLDLNVKGNKIASYKWTLLEADSSVDEDPTVEDMVDDALQTFVSGPDQICHTFGVNAFPFGTGHTLCDPFDSVVGHTNPTIQRWNALEDISNNVMVDAFLDLAKYISLNNGETDSKGNDLTDANTLSTTNGFRFDIVIPGSDDGFSGDITIGDLYDYYPIGAATGLAEYTGGRLKLQWESILNNVFDPNPFRQRGGWFLGFTNNMHFDIELNDDYPQSISAGKRINSVTINGAKLDDSKIYTLASCYPHGNPTDEVCRTSGATNLRFITAPEEDCGPGGTDNVFTFGNLKAPCQLDMSGSFSVVAAGSVQPAGDPPIFAENIFNPARFGNGVPVPKGGTQTGPLFLKVAPNDFVHPVDALRRYLKPTLVGHVVDDSTDGLGRVVSDHCASEFGCTSQGIPISEHGGAVIVQPSQGAGPAWEKREFVTDGQNAQ